MPAATPTTIPFGRTARRVDWRYLPPVVRREVEARIGARVVEAVPQTGGYTPGFAAVLVDAAGRRHFVKAASLIAQRTFAQSYQEEARTLASLPVGVPAPRLLWSTEVADWFVMSTAYVAARAPARPWTAADLAACSTMLIEAARTLSPPPVGLRVAPAASDLADWPGRWDDVRRLHSRLAHVDEAAALAARFTEVVGGDTLVHTDVRDDNLLLTDDGRVLLCDWTWPCVGAAWLDSLFLLIGPRGDGLDVEAAIAAHPLLAVVPAEHLDVVLALVTGYFLHAAAEPVPPSSPHVRDLQAWQGEVCWDWLSERRGWM